MVKKKGSVKLKSLKFKHNKKKPHATAHKKASKHSGSKKLDSALNEVFNFFKEDKENIQKTG
jgi:hypothetical protein